MQIDLSNQELAQSDIESRLKSKIIESGEPVTQINLSGNQIQSLDFLEKLNSSNQLPQLKMLILAKNNIKELKLHNFLGVLTLDVSKNPITSVQLQNMASLKSIDFRDCGIDDPLFLQILEQPIKPRHLRFAENKITDTGIKTICTNQSIYQLLNEQLSTLDLKSNPTQFSTLSQVRTQLPQDPNRKKDPTKLPALNSSKVSSRSNSTSSVFDGGLRHAEVKDQINQMAKVQAELISTWPQALAATLLGKTHPLVQQSLSYDHGNCKNKVCAALMIGIKCQPDIEEELSVGFTRKVGTLFCREYKQGNGMDCKQRCETVLQVMQRRIDKQQEEKAK